MSEVQDTGGRQEGRDQPFPWGDVQEAEPIPAEIEAWLEMENSDDLVREQSLPVVGPDTLRDLVTQFQEEVGMDLARLQHRLSAGAARYPLEASEALNQFTRLVNAHDLTYDYSEDPQARGRGHAELMQIRALAQELRQEDVKRIWDAKVDRAITGEHAAGQAARRGYYWQDRTEWQRVMARILNRPEEGGAVERAEAQVREVSQIQPHAAPELRPEGDSGSPEARRRLRQRNQERMHERDRKQEQGLGY
jgi:hypothetical protein